MTRPTTDRAGAGPKTRRERRRGTAHARTCNLKSLGADDENSATNGSALPGSGLHLATTLSDHLHALPAGPAGLRRRCVVALAAHGAEIHDIAAALAVGEHEVLANYGGEVRLGRLVAAGTLCDAVWRSARAGKSWAIRMLMKRLEDADGTGSSAPTRGRR